MMLRSLPRLRPEFELESDVVVAGAGAAGLSAALAAADTGMRVLIVSKGIFGSGSTPWAQGGLAAVFEDGDSAELHAADTQTAGVGLCRMDAVHELTEAAPSEIAALRGIGAQFDLNISGKLDLAREGGHSRHRVVHAGGDASGAEVSRTLRRATDAHKLIEFAEPAVVLDLELSDEGHVRGILVGLINAEDRKLKVGLVRTRRVILATGGVGQVFAQTTNPAGATGDGLAVAVRAGAVLEDLEFVQFHPTVLWHGGNVSGQQALITEALRGAGAQLIDLDGRRFMPDFHPQAELAPRDVVAVAMHQVMMESGAEHLWLDARALRPEIWREHFPTVFDVCQNAGVDPSKEMIPVVPGAHYFCGGIKTDLDGRTSVPGLYAVGEVACTGVHGANRLASNSLTESLHFGTRAGRAAPNEEDAWRWTPSDGAHEVVALSSRTLDASVRSRITENMQRECGISRDATGLQGLLRLLANLPSAPASQDLTLDDVEVCALHTAATLIASAALRREESRGCHRRRDFPKTSGKWNLHIDITAKPAAEAVYRISA